MQLMWCFHLTTVSYTMTLLFYKYLYFMQLWILILWNESSIHPLAYEVPPPKYTAEYILKLLLNPSIDCNWIFCTWPVSNIVGSATFVVDLTLLEHPDDVQKDFFGKWLHSGSHPFVFKATFGEHGEVAVENATGATGNIFYLRRLHCYHPSNVDFRRMLVFVSGNGLRFRSHFEAS